jgi:hemoglobin
MSDSLFDRIGGHAAMDAAVDLFYTKVIGDDWINHFFKTTDMKKQRAKQKAFLAMVFGGPNNYTGLDMRAAHKPMVENGLNDTHFDAVAGHLQSTLQELGVADDAVAEVMAIAGGARDDVLNR